MPGMLSFIAVGTSGLFPLPDEVLVVAVVAVVELVGPVDDDRALIVGNRRVTLKTMLPFSSAVS